MRKILKYALITAIAVITMTAALIIPGGVRSAKAATNAVSTFEDLSSAITNAAPGDTIEVTSDIIVTSQITINKALTVNGNGNTISVPVPGFDDSGVNNTGSSAFRVFNIVAETVTIKNTTIKGGAPNDYGGAGIYVSQAATLYLEAVTISNCGGTGSPGGGISNNGGIVFLKNCNVIRNGATYGGGFLNADNGRMFIENCSFSENRSLSSNGGGGAGENQAYLFINNSTFSNNKSTELGGAINHCSGTAYILNSTFSGNVNVSSSGYLGGALRSGSALFLANNIFAYNYTSDDNGSNYKLNDFDPSYWSGVTAYKCIFHGSTFSGGTNICQYAGKADGSDDELFTGGSTSQVLAADGTLYGTATIYQPYLARATGALTTSVPLRVGSIALNLGIPTAFTNGSGHPVIGYNADGTWVELTSTSASAEELELHRVTTDQNDSVRSADVPVVGAVASTASSLFMIKVNKVTGGTIIGGSVYGDTYTAGDSVALVAMPNDGYQFIKWDNASGELLSTGNPYSFTVSSSVTITPVFLKLAHDQYVITYIGNGNNSGSVPASSGTIVSASTTIPGNTGSLVKTGYNFNGWNTRMNGSGTYYAVGAEYTEGTNLTLYAQWVEAPIYTITFDSQGGSAVAPITAADIIAAPGNPTKDGWDFGGWYKEANCTNAWVFERDTVTDNITLYAKWTANPSAHAGDSETQSVVVRTFPSQIQTASGIQLSGEVALTGSASIIERGFVYSMIDNPTIGAPGVTTLAAESGTGRFTAILAGIQANTVYYVRAYAVTSEGTFYGRVVVIIPEIAGIPKTGENSSAPYGWLLCTSLLACIATWMLLDKRRTRHQR